MTRYLAPLAVVFALATTAHAQNYVTRSYSTTDAYGNSVTTTTQAPASAVGLIANQAFNNGGYNNGYNSGGYINGGVANGGFSVQYGGNVPTYYGNYPSYGGYGGYAGYPNYGYNQGYYGNYPTYQSCPPTYILPGQPTYVRPAPNQAPRTYVPGGYNPPLPAGTLYGSMAITPNPQGAPYASTPYNYGWNNRSDNGSRRGRNR